MIRQVNKILKTIVVDLTPVLPGGENGGAKIFVLELLRELAALAPKTQFVLLTQAASHDELAALDGANVRRRMVVGVGVTKSLRPRVREAASHMLRHLPIQLRGLAGQVGYRLNTALKRRGSGSLLHDMNADLLFCPFTAPAFFEAEIPTVCTIYDLQYKTYPEFFDAEDVANRDRTFIEACRRASALAAISDYTRESAVVHGGIDPERIRTIHLRMAHRVLPEARTDCSMLSGIGVAAGRYLVYPANFWRHKNHEMLLTAFGIACHKGLPGDIKLVCTGAPGARRDWLIGVARAMNLTERVIFPGYLPDAQLAALVSNCRGVVFPSLYEGFGLPVIEAMAAGVPVACSNVTSLPEVAAEAAILFNPRIPTEIAQSIAALVEDEDLRPQLVEAGRQRAQEFFDTRRMAREYWELFQYASAVQRRENLLTGVYADGWAGPMLSIQIAPVEGTRTLEIEVSAPEWLPQPQLTIEARNGRSAEKTILNVARGTSARCTIVVESGGGQYDVSIYPTFIPASIGHGDDQRELSVMLQKCCIARANGECVDLFPEKASA